PDHYPLFHLIDRDGKNDRILSMRNSGFDAAWSPDGRKIVYSQLEIYQNFSLYGDLYSYDLSKKETQKLSDGLRAKEVDYSPQGHFLVFVQQKLGKNRLALWNLKTSTVAGLTSYSDTFLISNPRWLSDEEKIVFSGWKKGRQNIYLFDRKTHASRQLTDDSFQNLTPSPGMTDDQILFVSDRTGVYNLYEYDLKTNDVRQLTNVLGGIFLPSLSPDRKEVLFSSYRAKGFDLAVMGSRSFFAGKPDEKELAKEKPEPFQENPQEVYGGLKSVSYSPWNTLFPRFWVPWGGVDEAGSQLGAWTSGIDVLRKHRYLGMALYGLESHRFSYLFDYMNDQFYPTIELGYSDMPKYYANLLSNAMDQRNSYWERRQILKINFLFPFLKLHSKHALKAGFERNDFSALSSSSGFLTPQTGALNTIKGGYLYDSSEEYPLSISKEEGRVIQLSIEDSEKSWGSDFNLVKYIANVREYHALFIPHNVLAAQLSGGVGQGEKLAQRAFQLGGPLVIDQPFSDQDEFLLRGYPAHQLIGQNMVVANIEYRFPFPLVEKGNGTFPYFIERLHAGVFLDYGNAWDQPPSIQDFKTGVGAEIKGDFTLFYHLPVRVRLGSAFGLNSSGEKQVYLSMGNSF
ncbi:MAG: TolB family protein, partial [Nitrospiria bacterium]